MGTTGEKEVLTTGDVARICRVAPRTVSKWVDTGKLRGYRIPGSRDRRIPLPQLIAFMRAHDIPLDGLDRGVCRIILLGSDVPDGLAEQINSAGRYELRVAQCEFEAGMIAQQFRPHVVVIDLPGGPDEALEVCRTIKASEALAAAKVIAAVDEACPAPDEAGEAFDGFLSRPTSASALQTAVEEVTNFMT